MPLRRCLIAAVLSLAPLCWAGAGEPVVKGTIRTIFTLGTNCLTVPATETYLRPGTRLEMRPCRNAPEQMFEWNVVSFEIKFNGLCVDAFRVGLGATQTGDPIGLWYCNQSPHQKWYPSHGNESWHDAFNIVGGGSPSSTLCMSIAGDGRADRAALSVNTCDGRDAQWFRLQPWPPLGAPVS